MDLRETKAAVMQIWRSSLSSKLLASYIYSAKTSKSFGMEQFAPREHRLREYFAHVAGLCHAAQARAWRDDRAAVAAGSFVVYFGQQLLQFALALAAAMEPLTAAGLERALDHVVVDHDGLVQKQRSILKIVLSGHVALRPDFVAYHCVTFYEAKVYLRSQVALKYYNERVLATFRDPACFWRRAHAAAGAPGSLFRYVALYGSFEAFRYFFHQLKRSARPELWYAVDAMLASGRMTANKLFFSLFHLTPGTRTRFVRKYFVSIFKMCFDDVMFRPLSYTYFNFERKNITPWQMHEVMLHVLSKNDFKKLCGTNICLYKQREFLLSLREMELFFLRFWMNVPLKNKLYTKRMLGIQNMIHNFIVCRQFRLVAVIFKDKCVENCERQMIMNQYFKKAPGPSPRRPAPSPRPLYKLG